MANAKQEFNEHTSVIVGATVKAAKIEYCEHYNTINVFHLKRGYSAADYDNFIKSLDFEYDDGYGGQELYGVIWYEDGTWSSRGEYDGAEWWVHNKCPDIPNDL
jgi:hypothetical protein